MSQKLSIPEPSLREHELIRDAAPMPELSAGFKSRVISECGVSIVSARRAFRLKVAGGVGAVCCLGLLFSLSIPVNDAPDRQLTAQPPEPQPVSPQSVSPGVSFGVPPGGSRITVDAPKPRVSKE